MNIFNEVEGLHGEMLATAGLRVLLIRSQACRNAFIKLLNKKSPVGLVSSRSHFSCYTEYATNHESLGAGRLDMIVELDSVVVGFEVKLAAEFQPDQPGKYEKELQSVAKALGSIRRGTMRSFVSVIAPESRREEVQTHVSQKQGFISWEEILAQLSKSGDPDLFVTTLVAEFSDFLADHLHFLPRFESWAPHLEFHWQSNGTDEQREFLRKLVQLLPGASGRVGSGETWLGYHFQPHGYSERTWIGFLSSERVKGDDSQGACLVISRKDSVPSPGTFKLVELENPVWIDGQFVSTWHLEINSAWNKPQDWLKVLKPFIQNAQFV